MKSNAIYTTSDAGLNRFFGKIYGLVGIGVGLSAVISYLMLFPLSHLFVNILMNYSWIYMAAIFVELALVFLASGAARRNTPAALPLFLVYSALNGFTLSFIIVQYTQAIVFQAFLSTAIVFFVMALIGVSIKRDLSGMVKFLMAALIGIIVASLVNIFFASSTMSFVKLPLQEDFLHKNGNVLEEPIPYVQTKYHIQVYLHDRLLLISPSLEYLRNRLQ